MALVYDDIATRDGGSSDLDGPIKVSESVTRVLTMAVLVFESITAAEAVVPGGALQRAVNDSVSVTESRAYEGLNLSRSLGDDIAVSNPGWTKVDGPLRVRDWVDAAVSLAPGGISTAVVDVIHVSEGQSRLTDPAYIALADTVSVYDDVGQDYPIIVRESVTAVLSDLVYERAVIDSVAVTESVTSVWGRLRSDAVAVSESVTRLLTGVGSAASDAVAVTENVATAVKDFQLTVTVGEDIAVSEFRRVVRSGRRVDNVAVTDFVVGFLSSPSPQSRVMTERTVVTDVVVAKYSALLAAVADAVAVRDGVGPLLNKNQGSGASGGVLARWRRMDEDGD